MPSINEIIERVDAVKPSPYGDEAKARWLEELDGKIAVEVLGTEAPVYGPERWDDPLLVAPPYDNLYELYVSAMIDYHNQEIDRYNNSMALFNTALEEFRRWYIRTHRPERAGGYVGAW